MTWMDNNTLTLTAVRDIKVNANISATGSTAGIVLGYGTGRSYTLTNGYSITLSGATPTLKIGVAGSEASYTVINSLGVAGDISGTTLQGMNGNLARKYALGSNIDATATSGWNAGTGFAPIGTFTGSFDGLGHSISNLIINSPSTNFVGLFGGTATGSIVRNVGLVGGSISGSGAVGGLVGSSNGTVSSSYSTGSVSGANSVGGVVGYNNGTVSSSYSTGSISGADYVGGVVGYNYTGSISSSYASGSVSGQNDVGGLVGINNSGGGGGIIQHSYATGNVSSSGSRIGGLVGYNFGGTVSNTYATGNVNVNGSGWVGGLVGYNSGTVSTSYWDTQTSGQTTGMGGKNSGATGLTTAQMMTQANFIPAGVGGTNWDFTSIWYMIEGNTRPFLRNFMIPVSLSATSISFTNQAIDAVSAAQTATLTNNGMVMINISGITASGDFARTTTCGATLAAGANCTISVTFTPTVAGARTGVVTITNDSPGSPHSISLSGSGVAVPIVTPSSGSNGSISPNTEQTVSYNGNTSFTITPNAGYTTSVGGTCGGTLTGNTYTTNAITANCTVTPTFTLNTYILTYTAGANGSITGTASQTINYGSSATSVTAVPATGYHFVNWTGTGGFVTTTSNPLTVTNITAAQTITANFAINTYALTYTAGANGSITGTSPQTVNHSSNGSAVTAVPAENYHFVNWSDASTANPRTDTSVTANVTVTVNFAIDAFAVSFASGGNGTLTGTANQTINYGSDATAVTAVPTTGYHFVNWTGTGGFVTTTTNPLAVSTVTAEQTITANFAIDTFAVTPMAGAGGTITPSTPQTLNYGSTTAFTVTPNTGYAINTVTGCNGTLSGETYITGATTGDCTVMATFSDVALAVMTLSTLSDGSRTNNNTLNISGTVTDNSGVQGLTVSGNAVTTNTDGSFSHALILNEGANIITTVATDLAGNQTTDTRTIILDTAAPTLVISTPADNSKTALSVATVTGTIDENSTVTVTLNGGTPQYASITGNTFTLDIVLASGVNTIEVTATDTAGNTSTQSTQKRTVTYDPDKPSLAITDPARDIRTNQGSVIVKGTVSDTLTAVSVAVSVDGNTYTPTLANGLLEQAVTFTTEKTYAINVTATDEAGNTTTVQRNIIYDITQPTIDFTVTTPTNNTSQTFTGTMEEGSTVIVTSATATIGTVTYPSTTTWSVNVTGMTEGSNTITATAKDAAGNEMVVAKEIVVDTVAPDTTITAQPSNPTNSTSASFSFTSTEADSTFECQLDSGGYSTCTSPKSYTGLTAGSHIFYVKANDSAGNTDAIPASYTWAIDTTVPAFGSTSYSSNSFINTATVGYSLSKAVSSGKITFTRTGGTADSSVHVYNFTASDITAGTHSINTGFVLVNGAIYTVTLEATDSAGNAGSVSNTNITYDTTSASVTIISPAANSVTNNAKVSDILSEDISSGDIVFTRTGGSSDGMSPYTYTLSASEGTAGSHTVDTGKVLMDGAIYTVSFENIKDIAGNQTASISTTNVTYDSTSVAITDTSPASNSIITNATIGYTLSEQAQSGRITFTWTGGTADGSSPHIYTMTASDLMAAAHNVTTGLVLVDGAFYTVTFEATDLIGNPATTVSNAMVYYSSGYGTGPIGNVDSGGASAMRVDGFDLIKLSLAFGSRSGDVNWNPACDLDGNGTVDGNDLVILGSHFGEVE